MNEKIIGRLEVAGEKSLKIAGESKSNAENLEGGVESNISDTYGKESSAVNTFQFTASKVWSKEKNKSWDHPGAVD